uniref:Uncharacterized protein n=1 Tax=Coccidioides posadasii RMSCC 3488 TaxID=454284 RepID=A0A0J6F1C7_COCPO|nr:hypothetical protein CPAG_00246 [Coccidioides posadasii RMSCC 3488]
MVEAYQFQKQSSLSGSTSTETQMYSYQAGVEFNPDFYFEEMKSKAPPPVHGSSSVTRKKKCGILEMPTILRHELAYQVLLTSVTSIPAAE